jgi:hypothetical protein
MPLSGCGGSDDGYQAVSGMVTFQGNLVPEGTIQFFTKGAQPVVCGGAMIRDGAYHLPREHGLAPGSYLVRINSPERIAVPGNVKDEMMAPFQTRDRIPAKFNTDSAINIKILAGTPAQFNFDLQ